MKFDLKPQDDRKVALFANSGEAIVFWLSLAGLIFLAIITIYRSLALNRAPGSGIPAAAQNELLQRFQQLEAQTRLYRQETDSLRRVFEALRKKLDAQQARLDSAAAAPRRPLKPVSAQERSRRRFLREGLRR